VTAAPFAREHALEIQLPFIRRALGAEVAICPILVGGAGPDLVAAALRALWGGPETAIVVSSDLSHYLDDQAARARDAGAAAAIELLKGDALTGDLACGHRAIAGLLAEARARDLRATTLDLRNSAATRGGRTASSATAPSPSSRRRRAPRRALAPHARRSRAQEHRDRPRAPRRADHHRRPPTAPLLAAQRASFVTLNLDGRLRGCIGSLAPHRPLAADVAENAFKAAFADPRFQPLTTRRTGAPRDPRLDPLPRETDRLRQRSRTPPRTPPRHRRPHHPRRRPTGDLPPERLELDPRARPVPAPAEAQGAAAGGSLVRNVPRLALHDRRASDRGRCAIRKFAASSAGHSGEQRLACPSRS
jgi:hypothetical protein